jgi:hypothetical protein
VSERDVAGCVDDGCENRSVGVESSGFVFDSVLSDDLQARYECIRGHCPCGSKCANHRFQSGAVVPIAVVDCGRKGVGVLTLERLAIDTFIGEYVGEVVSGTELQRRRQVMSVVGWLWFGSLTPELPRRFMPLVAAGI